MSANPFYIQPAGDMSQGLAGLSSVLKDVGEQRRLREEQKAQEEAMAQAQTEVQQAVESGDTDQINQVAIKYPMFAETVYGGMKIKNDEQKGRFAADLRQLVTAPPDQIPTILERRIQKIDEMGGDSTQSRDELAEFLANPEGQIKNFQFAYAAVAPENEYKAWRESTAPKKAPETREVQVGAVTVTQEFNPVTGVFEEIARAPRMSRSGDGLTTDRVQSSQILSDGTSIIVTASGATKVLDPSGQELTGEARAEAIRKGQEYETELTSERAGGRTAATIGQKEGQKAFESLNKVYKNIGNIDEAIVAIDNGADTGVIASKFPSWNAATIELENIQRRLGLDVVGAVTFGALSEGELGLALATALPTNLDQADLKKWLLSKKAAQNKLAGYLSEQASYLSTPGNNLGGWMEKVKTNNPYQNKDVREMSDEELLR